MNTTDTPLKNLTRLSMAFLYILAASSLLFMWLTPAAAARFGIEDGPAENMTALLMLLASISMLYHGSRIFKHNRTIGLIAFLISIAFFVFAGEEISWGQRIFSLESGDFMQQHNWQGEINFHNLHTDIFNIAFHYGAFIFLVVLPLFRDKVVGLLKQRASLAPLERFVPPTWLVAPSLILLGMLDPRFIFIIEKPWAAYMYLFALGMGFALGINEIATGIRSDETNKAILFGLSLVLISVGTYVAYFYAIDKQAPNIISEFKELFIASALCLYALHFKSR